MSEDWWWRRRRRFIDDFLRDLEDMIRYFEEDIENMMKGMREYTHEHEKRIAKPFIWGYRIYIGPDGVPRMEQFGNVRRRMGKPVISEEREPIIDVFEDKDTVSVIAELPGVDKDKISVEVSSDKRKLYIRASDTNRRYYKEVNLPCEVEPESAKAEYRNGILEVKLKKSIEEGKGFKIKID